jgi:hypothetical protein
MFNINQNSLYIAFNKPSYFPGEQVIGTVYLNTVNSFDAHGIELTFFSEEHVKYIEYIMKRVDHHNPYSPPKRGGGRGPTRSGPKRSGVHKGSGRPINRSGGARIKGYRGTHLHSKGGGMRGGVDNPYQVVPVPRVSNLVLYSFKFILNPQNSQLIAAGQYAYPFSFILPVGLPGSFEYYDHEISAYIQHLITARAYSYSNPANQFMTTNLLFVKTDSSKYNFPLQISDEYEMGCCCFCKDGNVKLLTQFEKQGYYLGENIRFYSHVDNRNCGLDVTGIIAEIKQEIKLTTPNSQKSLNITRTITKQRLKNLIEKNTTNKVAFNFPLKDENNPIYNYYKDCRFYNLYGNPNTLHSMQCSTKGSNLECNYYLSVYLSYDECCRGTPYCTIPLYITIGDNYSNYQFTNPQGYNPQPYTSTTIDLPAVGAPYQSTGDQLDPILPPGIANPTNVHPVDSHTNNMPGKTNYEKRDVKPNTGYVPNNNNYVNNNNNNGGVVNEGGYVGGGGFNYDIDIPMPNKNNDLPTQEEINNNNNNNNNNQPQFALDLNDNNNNQAPPFTLDNNDNNNNNQPPFNNDNINNNDIQINMIDNKTDLNPANNKVLNVQLLDE